MGTIGKDSEPSASDRLLFPDDLMADAACLAFAQLGGKCGFHASLVFLYALLFISNTTAINQSSESFSQVNQSIESIDRSSKSINQSNESNNQAKQLSKTINQVKQSIK